MSFAGKGVWRGAEEVPKIHQRSRIYDIRKKINLIQLDEVLLFLSYFPFSKWLITISEYILLLIYCNLQAGFWSFCSSIQITSVNIGYESRITKMLAPRKFNWLLLLVLNAWKEHIIHITSCIIMFAFNFLKINP